jgi:hypothetical protein
VVEVTSRVKVLIVAVAVAFLVTALLSWCTVTAREVQAKARVRIPAPVAFEIEAKPMGRAGQCWYAEKAWELVNASGTAQATPGFTVLWCENKAGTKVIYERWSLICKDTGGYYTYHGCKKQRGSFGFTWVPFNIDWTYSHTILGVTNYKTPSVDAEVRLDGWLVGTFYYDRI